MEIQLKLTVSAFTWSQSRPLVLLFGTETGSVAIMDLVTSCTEPISELIARSAYGLHDKANGSVTSMMFSAKR
jgi:hypothetical protein